MQLAEVFPEVDLGELGSIVDLKAKQSSDGCCDFEDVLEQLIDEVMIRHLNFVEDWDLNEEDDWLGVDSWRVQKLNRRKFKGVNWEPGALQTSSEPVSYAELLSPHTTRRQNIKTLPFYYQPFSLLPVLSRHDLGVQDLRDEISDLLKEKHAVLGKAAESYRKKGLTGYQTASYYAEQASSLDFKIRALKLAAAHRTFVKLY